MRATGSKSSSTEVLNPYARDDRSDVSLNVLPVPKIPEGWDSSWDPENPKNWSMDQRIVHTAIPSLFGFAV